MSDRRKVWQTLSELVTRLEKGVSAGANGSGQEIRKLGKAQFKANMLAEKQASQWEQAIATVQETQAQYARLLETDSAERVAEARHELLEAVIPALDGLENAIASGQSYLEKRDKAASSLGLSRAQATVLKLLCVPSWLLFQCSALGLESVQSSAYRILLLTFCKNPL